MIRLKTRLSSYIRVSNGFAFHIILGMKPNFQNLNLNKLTLSNSGYYFAFTLEIVQSNFLRNIVMLNRDILRFKALYKIPRMTWSCIIFDIFG